jgi:Sec7-like guanine-nucleotide exchange factor
MGIIMKNKKKSTFDRIMSDSEQKKRFEKEYVQFLFSELLLEAMDEEHISVRALSKESGVSTSVIQNMRSMKPTNITIKTMASLLKPLGYQLAATKGRRTVILTA